MVLNDRDLNRLESPTIRYLAVSKQMSDNAVRILNERIANGEDAYDVLKIDRKFDYYVEKIVKGLVVIDDTLYYRITNENPHIEHHEEIISEIDKEEEEDNEMGI